MVNKVEQVSVGLIKGVWELTQEGSVKPEDYSASAADPHSSGRGQCHTDGCVAGHSARWDHSSPLPNQSGNKQKLHK